MNKFKFEGFVFDTDSYRLTHREQEVKLRPKALQLLRLLIVNKDRVVSKSEILSSLWGSAYARDHMLFQLISELRKAPLDPNFIRTQPNEGYQWNVESSLVRFNTPRPFQVSARLIVGTLCLLSVLPFVWLEHTSQPISAQLPAYSAFTKGVVAAQKGEREQAVKWLKFALNENPESAEISLFLAETLHKQDKTEEATGHLEALLQQPHLGNYDQVTATNLLSRIRQKQGRYSDALRYAKMSSQTGIIAQCSIDVLDERIEFLEDKLVNPVASSQLDPQPFTSGDITPTQKLDDYSEQCNQLKQAIEETSFCQPDHLGFLYADARRTAFLKIS